MCENSDGDEGSGQRKFKPDIRKMQKFRSSSLGSIKLSRSEINKIIGAEDKKAGEETKTKSDINSKNSSDTCNVQIHGGTNNESAAEYKSGLLNDNINQQSEIDILSNPNDIFTPRRSVQRTPPGNTNNDKNREKEGAEIENSNKRSRPETSPGIESNTKRLCDGLNIPHENEQGVKKHNFEENETIIDKEEQEPIATDTIILELFIALDKINEVAYRECEGKTSLSKEDQKSIRNSNSSIHKGLTLLIHKLGKLEKENTMLQYKLEHRKTEGPLESIRTQKSYAEVVHTPHQIRTKNSTAAKAPNSSEDNDWTTPTTVKKHETIIRIENVDDPKKVMQQLKKEINAKETGGGFKSVRQLRSGAVIVESFDKNQQEKLKITLESKEHIKIKESENTDPMFVITGIERGYSNEEFVEELIRLNDEIEMELGYAVKDKIKIITRKQCRNPNKENWILQAPPNIAKWFFKKQLINFDLVKVYVKEHFNLAICFKCCGFGHVAKYCNGKECCHKCGGEHYGKNCNEGQELKCPNCTKMKYNEKRHSARDINCPVYKERLNRFKNQINYGKSFL